MTVARPGEPLNRPDPHNHVLAVYDALVFSGSWETHKLTFLSIMEEYQQEVRQELVNLIATRVSFTRPEFTRKEEDMSDDMDKPRIIIPPSINIGERDVQLRFSSVGDGMFFELVAQDGDGDDPPIVTLFRFFPGKGFWFVPGAGIESTKDFPTDSDGRMQLIDNEQKPLVQVYPEQVISDEDKPSSAGKIKFMGMDWWLEKVTDGLSLRVQSKGGKLGVLTITENGIKLWKGVPQSATGIPSGGDTDSMVVLDQKY